MGDVERDECFRASRGVFGGGESDIQLVVTGEEGGERGGKKKSITRLKIYNESQIIYLQFSKVFQFY